MPTTTHPGMSLSNIFITPMLTAFPKGVNANIIWLMRVDVYHIPNCEATQYITASLLPAGTTCYVIKNPWASEQCCITAYHLHIGGYSRCVPSFTHKHAHLNTLTLIDAHCAYFTPNPSCLNLWLCSRLVTKEAVSRLKWLHYQGHLLESNLARLGPQTGPANLLNGHSFISRCLGAVACEVHSFCTKQDGCDI